MYSEGWMCQPGVALPLLPRSVTRQWHHWQLSHDTALLPALESSALLISPTTCKKVRRGLGTLKQLLVVVVQCLSRCYILKRFSLFLSRHEKFVIANIEESSQGWITIRFYMIVFSKLSKITLYGSRYWLLIFIGDRSRAGLTTLAASAKLKILWLQC